MHKVYGEIKEKGLDTAIYINFKYIIKGQRKTHLKIAHIHNYTQTLTNLVLFNPHPLFSPVWHFKNDQRVCAMQLLLKMWSEGRGDDCIKHLDVPINTMQKSNTPKKFIMHG